MAGGRGARDHCVSEQVPETAKSGRLDLRNTPLVTIDGEDARDFDDAVYCERVVDGFRLLVAIADVAHYVKSNTALDSEARNRGNSVYFPDRVIPMLPEVLSNGLCSLNPHVDRLCLVCEMRVTAQGDITRSKFQAAVMRSAARLTYIQVAAMLVDKDPTLRHEHARLLPHLEDLYGVYQAFAKVGESAVPLISIPPKRASSSVTTIRCWRSSRWCAMTPTSSSRSA